MHVKRDVFIPPKKRIYMSKETYSYLKGDLLHEIHNTCYTWSTTQDVCRKHVGKRDLFIPQKRPMHISKGTAMHVKRDVFIPQKRPTT